MVANTMNTTAAAITVRHSLFRPEQLSRHYFSGQSPLMSHLLTALSMTFPKGEQFFVHSVRQVRDQVTDPQLQADISGFIGQEAMHSQAHAQFNAAIQKEDYQLHAYEQQITNGMATLKTRSLRRQLAATVAYEHFTALIATHLLSHPSLFNGFDDNMRQLWLWHALEELEHKSVAFEVYQQVFGNDAPSLAQRRRSMRTISVGFVMGIASMTKTLLWQDRKNSLLSVPKLLLNARDSYYIAEMLLKTLPYYLAYYRADFHPNHIDHQPLIEQWREQLAINNEQIQHELKGYSRSPRAANTMWSVN
ncbi:metal-dependent hydrolase [Moraxellaceae bacterium AER2_44_116]|nr:metal-dependent hydrolase [Moraxellaceae bacterium]TQC98384.1 metal-dependent hydrolase [Moraxellaceae bacterium AER2_44_116]